MGGAAADGTLGTISGVVVPTCENMWGVLIFLRFFYVVGHAGVWQSLVVVLVSFLSAFLTALSLSAMSTNGPVQAGGSYYIISRALGHKLGGAVGCMYYVGLSLLAVLEILGAVEVMLYVEPGLAAGMGGKEGAVRLWAIVLLGGTASMVWGGMQLVSRMGLIFAAVVGLTLASYYAGLIAAPLPGTSPMVTGLSAQTLRDNWGPGYSDGVTFSDVLSVFFPCFTGILAGGDRAMALKNPEHSIPYGTLIAICLSAALYASYMIMWGAVADREYLKNGPSSAAYGAAYGGGGETQTGRHLLGGGGESMSVVSEIAWPLALPTQIGIIIASLSQALQCLITAPRVLHAIAADGTVPFLARAAPLNKAGEPAVALLITSGLCAAACMIGSLDTVAPLLSICFLAMYAALNFSTFVLGLTRAPSWRPTWTFFHWSVGLAGFLLCTILAFVIRWYFAFVAIAALGALVAYIESRQVQVDWGSALGGIRLDLATAAMLDLAHERRHTSNWRPQLLCLPGFPTNRGKQRGNRSISNRGGAGGSGGSSGRSSVGERSVVGSGLANRGSRSGGGSLDYGNGKGNANGTNQWGVVTAAAEEAAAQLEEAEQLELEDKLLGLSSQLKKGRGLCVVAEVAEGSLARERGLSARVTAAREALEGRMEAKGVRGFAHVVVANSFREGKSFAIQGLGFGGLEPNTVLLGWPRRQRQRDVTDEEDDDVDDDEDAREAEEEERFREAEILVETVCECTAAEKALLLCVGLDAFPSLEERVEGFVDVWWVVHDGGLLLMIAHLLLRHKTWAGCKLRVHTVVQSAQDPAAVRRSLQKVLAEFRINAEVSVVEAGDDADMYAYTHDWTMRKNQAEEFRGRLMHARSSSGGVTPAAAAAAGAAADGAAINAPRLSSITPGRLSSITPGDEQGQTELTRAGSGGGMTALTFPEPPGEPSELSTAPPPVVVRSPSAAARHSSTKLAFPSEIDMLEGLARDEIETSDALEMRHARRTTTTTTVEKHTSLATIFDIFAEVAPTLPSSPTPPRSPPPPAPILEEQAVEANEGTGGAGDSGTVETAEEGAASAAAAASAEAAATAVSTNDVRVTIEEVEEGGHVRINIMQQQEEEEEKAAGDGGEGLPAMPLPSTNPFAAAVIKTTNAATASTTTLAPIPIAAKKPAGRGVTFASSIAIERSASPPLKVPPPPPPHTPLLPALSGASWAMMDEDGPAALNRIILGKSSDAQLVIINLPDPDAIVMQNPAAYARYTEGLVRGLPRVIFVHGTGREVYTSAP